MKTIGLIGGMSSESAALYYQLINKEVNAFLGKHHTAEILLLSLNFNEVVEFMHQAEWSKLSELLIRSAKRLEDAGVEVLAICCNSAHKVFPDLLSSLKVPIIHILEPTVKAIQQCHIKKVGLLGNKFTMEEDFYQKYLKDYYGIDCIIPTLSERDYIHRIIYQELCHGVVDMASRSCLREIIIRLQERGADGIILGCTELPMLIPQHIVGIPVFNTTKLHSIAIANYSVQNTVLINDNRKGIESEKEKLFA